MKKVITVLLSFTLLLLSGCKTTLTEHSATRILFDTVVQIKVFGCGEEILKEAFLLCERYENLFSRTVENSDISRVNKSSGEPVEVDAETVELLETALEYCELSKGRFDISICPVTQLWDFSAEQPLVPQESKLKAACALVDYKNIVVDRNFVAVKNGAKIDLGAVAKGYIADRLAEFLQKKRVKKAIINLGGNLKFIKSESDGEKYTVGIKKPFSESGELSAVIKVDAGSVVTSGTYERCFKIGDTLYHHILNTESGMPIDSIFDSVTVVCGSSTVADIMSTFCYTVGYEEACKEVEKMQDVEAVFIMNSGDISVTSGLQISEGDTPVISLRNAG
ncbi:MAG: FAD:protein FMN transferase [bacterium]|nr:FAD:protein FMN transferase [bacterium]